MTANYNLFLRDEKYDLLLVSAPTYDICLDTLEGERLRLMSLFEVTQLHYVIVKDGRVFESAWV